MRYGDADVLTPSEALTEEGSTKSASQGTKVEEDFAVDDEAMVHFLTPEESWDSFDRAARRYLRMSGEEFIAAWDAGRFDDDPDQPALVRVSLLLPGGR